MSNRWTVSAATVGVATVLVLGLGVASGTARAAGSTARTVMQGAKPTDASLASSITVKRVPNTIVLSSSATPAIFSQPVTVTARVSPASTQSLPSAQGPVEFFDGGKSLGSATLHPNGESGSVATATLVPLTGLALGPHDLTASYGGDSVYEPSSASPLLQGVTRAPTVTRVTSSDNPSSLNQPVLFSATVHSTGSATAQPTGSVVFTVDGTPRPAVVLDGDTAKLPSVKLAPGSHAVSAQFQETSDFSSSSDDLNGGQEASRASSTTALSTWLNPGQFGEQVPVSVLVKPVGPAPSEPSGQVDFYVNRDEVGSATLNSSGQAPFLLPRLNYGRYVISAVYRGDHDFSPSTAPPVFEAIAS